MKRSNAFERMSRTLKHARCVSFVALSLVFGFGLAQDKVVLQDTVFGTPPLELGQSIEMGWRYTKKEFEAAAVATTITPLGRTQVMSNRPENVSGEGVLYRGTVNKTGVDGAGSVYFYHVNADLMKKRFGVAVRNPGEDEVSVTVTALGTAKAGRYGLRYGGQEVAYEVLSPLEPYTLTLEPGAWAWLEPELPKTPVERREGATLQAELETSGPVEVLVVALDEGTQGVEGLPDIPANTTGAGRGTFPGAERNVKVGLTFDSDEEQGFTVAPGTDWVFGVDEMTGAEAQNRGNYGMLYQVSVDVQNETGADKMVRFYVVNIGCVISGAIRLEDGRTFKLPEDNLGVLDVNNLGTAIGQVAVKEGETGTFRFDFTPPGFSCLPIGVVARAYDPAALQANP